MFSKKIAIVVDSSCGLTKEQAEKLNWHYLPLVVEIDSNEYLDGVDLTSDNLFDVFKADSKTARTSASKIGQAHELLDKLSQEYDKIIVYTISMYLSSQYSFFKTIENDFPKIVVVNSKSIAFLTVMQLLNFENKLKDVKSEEEFEALLVDLEKTDQYSVSLVPKYNNFLVKGGRLSPQAALLAKLLNIVPIIKFENGELKKEGKGRIFERVVTKVIQDKLSEDFNPNKNDVVLLHSNNLQINSFKNKLTKKYNVNCYIFNIPSVVAIHTGPEALVVIKMPKMNAHLVKKLKSLNLIS